MRVIADLASFKILQEEKTPEVGEANPFNGRFALPVPDGASSEVDSSTYILPQDGGDLATSLAQALLARFPMYSNIMYNFLLEDADIADLDLAASGPGGEYTRVQTGRGIGPGPLGQAPNTTALLPAHIILGVPRPGCLVTDIIDIGPSTGGAGADEFLLWWYIWEFETSLDIASDYGLFNGVNEPAERRIKETDQEPSGFEVWITHDNGANWTGPVGRLEPTDLITFNTQVRLAFLNYDASRKVYLAAYGVMY